MEPMSRTERAALCNSALEAGEEAPTLCGVWTVKDLVIHLLVRERDPLASPGILIPQLEKLTERSARRMADQDFTALVERVRSGPPRWSPMAVPAGGPDVQHPRVLRAPRGHPPRHPGVAAARADRPRAPDPVQGRGHGRQGGSSGQPAYPSRFAGPTGSASARAVLAKGNDPVVITGEPPELVMYLFGRDQHTGLSFDGPQAHVDALASADLGISSGVAGPGSTSRSVDLDVHVVVVVGRGRPAVLHRPEALTGALDRPDVLAPR